MLFKTSRNNQNIFKLCSFILILILSTNADVPYVGYSEGKYLVNVELIGCFEIDKNPNPVSTLIWVGYAYVYPLQGENYTHGFEGAAEVRFKKNIGRLSSHFFVSSYVGFGNMYLIEYYKGKSTGRKEWYPGISTGIKAGYSINLFEWYNKKFVSGIFLEPYTGISISNTFSGVVDNPLVTVGLRIVTNFKF